MDYIEALRWLRTLPDFERTGEFSGRVNLEPMCALLHELGDPHAGRPTIHVAGTKGKGSTCVMIEAILRAAGLRTGCYISPHLHRHNERIRIDGAPADRDAFAAALVAVREALGAVAPKFPDRTFIAFDALTAAAFVTFRVPGAEVQVIEVGLGGALDSTNVFDEKDVAVITPISLEHTAILGNTIAEIAAEKAGIITSACTVVVAPQRESAVDVIRARAADRGARLVEVAQTCRLTPVSHSLDGQVFKLQTGERSYALRLPLLGKHQLENAATAVVACEELARVRGIELSEARVREGLAGVSWPARLEALKRKPLVVIDGAHNGDSARRLAAAIREQLDRRTVVFLVGTLVGKDVAAMADAVAPIAQSVYVTGWPGARAMDVRTLAGAFRGVEAPVYSFDRLPQAFDAALADAGEGGALVAFGALAFVAKVREYLLGIEFDMIEGDEAPPHAGGDGGTGALGQA